MTLTDLTLSQPLPIQLSQVGNYVVINDPAFPPLSCTVVNGYDAYGNALSSVQVFQRTAKLVRKITSETFDETIPNPIQLSQVTNYIPFKLTETTFPPLSTTVVNGYDAYGNALSSVQVFYRTLQVAVDGSSSTLVKTTPSPIQLSQVGNYVEITNGIAPLSTIVVNGYDAYGNALSSVQIFNRQASIIIEADPATLNYAAPNPIQLQQVTNYVQIDNSDSTFPALSTIVVDGYNAYGNAISATQIFSRFGSLVYPIDSGTTLDVNQPLPIQLAQIGNYVPLANNDSNYPALSTTVVEGYDAFGNAISSVQVFPRMVSLIYYC